MDKRSNQVIGETNKSKVVYDLNPLIELIWHDLGGQVPRARIRQVASGLAAKFDNAPVTTNIPLFIRHLTREWLKEEIESVTFEVRQPLYAERPEGFLEKRNLDALSFAV